MWNVHVVSVLRTFHPKSKVKDPKRKSYPKISTKPEYLKILLILDREGIRLPSSTLDAAFPINICSF